MKSKLWIYACVLTAASFLAAPSFAQDAAQGDMAAEVASVSPAEWALRSGLALGPAVDTFGFVGVLDADLAYRPHSLPMVFRLEAIPAAFAITKDGGIYAGYARVLVGVSLEYLEISLGPSISTDGFDAYSVAVFGGVSIDARFGRLDGTHVALFADTAINPDALEFEFGRIGGAVAVALPRNWTLRAEGEFNAAGIVRGTLGARTWLRGEGETNSLALGGRLGYAGVFRDLIVIDDGSSRVDSAGGPTVGIDVEYRF